MDRVPNKRTAARPGKISILFVVLGALLLAAALFYFVSNELEAYAAAESADAALEMLRHQESCEAPVIIREDSQEESWELEEPEEEAPRTRLWQSDLNLEALEEGEEAVEESVEAATEEIPVVHYNGNDYMGYLEIPALELQLPVMSDWSYEKLDISPCRFSGSLQDGDLILMAHNYSQFFGKLKKLSPGDMVYFTDGNQQEHAYQVSLLETLSPEDLTGLQSGDWDLTLFTCTVGGKKRVTVRCTLVE